MWKDPIVADVHRTREKLSAEFDFDVKAIFADLRHRQSALGARLVPQEVLPIQALQPIGADIPHGEKGDISIMTVSSSSPRQG